MPNKSITAWELHQLESAPKSKLRRAADRAATFLPIILIGALIAEYKLIPNFPKYAANPIAYPISNLYVYLASAFGAALLAYFIVSLASRKAHEKLLRKTPLYCALMILLIAYDCVTLKTGKLKMPYFPWADRILLAIYDDRLMLLDCISNSLKLLFSGYLIGSAAGLITGVAAGWSRRANYWVLPLIKLLGPIPSTTWISIILVVASSLFGGSVFMIALGVWYPVTMASLNGVSGVQRGNYEAARTFGLGSVQLVFKVAVPAAMPSIFNGLTQGMSVACTALMVAEMLGVESGLGWYINWQRGWAEFAKMYAAVIVICLTFTAVNLALTLVKRRVLRYQEDWK
ncbi:MAG: ABC transporter permease subunit [Oscillospiraceae bacterium]|jgi:NitT/TauT family transport system permease protein|nr:ABC transporter permease subunit [Oscillospiraceae bacterium]